MKKLVLAAATILAALSLQAKTALVVITHGSPSPTWNTPVLALEDSLRARHLPGIDYVRVALMEYTEPHIAAVIRDCEAQGVDTVLALPLFVAPSTHSDTDIPNLLGLKYDPEVRAELAEEELEVANTPMRIFMGPTMTAGNLLHNVLVKQVHELSSDPQNEAVLILAHGDPYFLGYWQELLLNLEETVKRNTEIGYIDSGLVEMGQQIVDDVAPMLQKAAAQKPKILVQGVYLTSSIAEMARRFHLTDRQDEILKDYPGVTVTYSEDGLLPKYTAEVCDWIAQTLAAWPR